jgi:hypothetical protein
MATIPLLSTSQALGTILQEYAYFRQVALASTEMSIST